MMTLAEAIVAVHTQLAQKYDYEDDGDLSLRIQRISEEDSQQVIRLCERDLTPGKMVLMGLCHLHTPGAQRDVRKAIEWFQRSADLGDPGAMCELAECYEYGTGVTQDRNQALVWRRRSAELGNPTAMFEVALKYRKEHNNEQAFRWFQRCADLGHVRAMVIVGTCYLDGNGVSRDDDLAITCFQKAIDICPSTTVTFDAEESLDRLLRNKPDPHAFVRYYCQLYSSASGARREYYRKKLHDSRPSGDSLDIIDSWIHLDKQLTALKAETETLKTENDVLRTEVAYQPGGFGFQEAMSDFVGKASPPTSSDGPDTYSLKITEHDGIDP